MYARMEGGVGTHVRTLTKELSKKHDVNIVSQEDLTFLRLGNRALCVDKVGSLEKIKSAIRCSDIFHIHETATSSELILKYISADFNMVNSFHIGTGKSFYGKIGRIVADYIAKLHASRSKAYIASGLALKQILDKYKKSTIVCNGIDPSDFKPEKSERFFDGFTVGYLGRVDPEKNIFSLIKACKNTDVNLVVAGYGKYSKKLKQLNSNKIKYIGKTEYPATSFYNAIDVFASPSFFEAGLSNTVLEAMSYEKPVITGSCGGEEYRIREDWGIVSKTDPDSISKNILKIKNSDYVGMGQEARKEIFKTFSIQKMANDIEKVYKSVLNNSSKKSF